VPDLPIRREHRWQLGLLIPVLFEILRWIIFNYTFFQIFIDLSILLLQKDLVLLDNPQKHKYLFFAFLNEKNQKAS
jgi:hypothetical protein